MKQRIEEVIKVLAASNPIALALIPAVGAGTYLAVKFGPAAFCAARFVAFNIVGPVASWLF